MSVTDRPLERGDRVQVRYTHPGEGWRGMRGRLVNVPGDVLNPRVTDEPTSRYSMTFEGREGVFAGIRREDLLRVPFEFEDKHGREITEGARVACEDFDDEEAIVVSRCSEDGDMRDGVMVALPASITVRFDNGDEETITRTCPRWQDDDTFIPVAVLG